MDKIAIIILPILLIPVVLSCWNIFTFVRQIRLKQSKSYEKIVELIAIPLGFVYTIFYLELTDIRFVSWSQAVLSDEKHGMLAPEYLPAFFIITAVACLGFVVARFVPLHRQPPLVTVLCISAIYLGAIECIV